MTTLENEIFFKKEKELLDKFLKKQNISKKSILSYIDKIATVAISTFNSTKGEISYQYLTDIKTCLTKVDTNINKLEELIKQTQETNVDILNYRENYTNVMNEVLQNDYDIEETFYKLIEYSKLDFSTLSINDIKNAPYTLPIPKASTALEIKKEEPTELQNISTTNIIEQENVLPVEQTTKPKEENKEPSISDAQQDLTENTLIISEVKQIVQLPYTKTDLDKILETDKQFTSYQQIIDEKYTIPISYYKYSSITRFKEAYSLVKNRSNGTIKDAFDLGLEVFFKYDLNPAIITACRNIDELDIYLSCLEDNELDKFYCFNIKFEMLPTLSNKSKKDF